MLSVTMSTGFFLVRNLLVSMMVRCCVESTSKRNTQMTVFVLVLTIFNEGAYLTFKSIFDKALNLF